MVEAIAFKMSRNSERSLSSDSMETSDTSDSSGQDWGVFDGQMSPYGDEPLAEVCDDQSSDSDDEETDSNGLTPAVLAARLVVSTSNKMVKVSKMALPIAKSCS